jgi:peptidoglycan/xylan/chitin deacetylase (PgdA/CDA1 family)
VSDLRPAGHWFYYLKAGATHARSLLWRARGGPVSPGLRILFYHRISDDRDELAVSPRRFREQMAFLAAEGYRVVDVETAAAQLGDEPAGTIGLSFDDGYADVGEHALPVLAEQGFTATVFVATGVTDGRARFGWYRRQPPLLSWDEIRGLDREGVLRFDAHTVTHPNLLTLADEQARAEIEDGKRELEERLEREVTTFCYPAGLFGARERGLVEAAGYSLACSCEPGPNTARTDRLALRRNQVDARDRLLDFRAKVAGAHDSPLPGRALTRRVRYSASSRS